MVERICPRCDAGNPSEHAYCGRCGAALDQPLAPRPAASLAQRSWQVPVPWKQAGRVMALGVATLAAEAGLAWLQRRQQQQPQPLSRPQPPTTARVIAMGWRVTETWQGGHLQQRTEEKVMWLEPQPPKG
ncbi:MAG TPA: hypothetical protein VFZ66_07395 [Herpetosiphonaceae bacterium]